MMVKWTFQKQLMAMIFVLMLGAVGGSSIFILNLYRKDKLAVVYQNELSNLVQASHHLENLLLLSDVIDLNKVPDAKKIIMLFENPCSRDKGMKGAVSKFYQKQLADLDYDPSHWTESLELFRACTGPEKTVQLIPSQTQLMVPYIAALIRRQGSSRFVMLAMDGFTTSARNTLFMTNMAGDIIWSADGTQYAENALLDTGIKKDDLKNFRAALGNSTSTPQVIEAGSEGLLSFSKTGDDWTLYSLTYRPSAMQPVVYALRQSVLLVVGLFFLCLFIAKNSATLITRPLAELRAYAERLGSGDFAIRLAITGRGDDEFSVVKMAFNTMTEKIANLIRDTKEKTILDGELKLAQEVQQMFIPKPLIKTQFHSLHSIAKSAARCGGDWWGYVEVPRENRPSLFVLLIGDVTGHGTASALITATVRGALSMMTSWIKENPDVASDPRQINKYFNRAVFEASEGFIKMTFFAAIFDPESRKMICSNAGHVRPYMIIPSADQKSVQLKVVGTPGVPLGYTLDETYEKLDEFEWQKGYQLFLYTDGFIEVTKGSETIYDRKNLKKILKDFGTMKGGALLSQILKDRNALVKDLPLEDDLLALVCEATE